MLKEFSTIFDFWENLYEEGYVDTIGGLDLSDKEKATSVLAADAIGGLAGLCICPACSIILGAFTSIVAVIEPSWEEDIIF